MLKSRKMQNINTFIKNRWQDENIHLSGKKNVSEKNTPDEEYETDVAICAGSKMQVEGGCWSVTVSAGSKEENVL